MSFLKDHPFAVSAHFDCSTVLTFAVPKEELQGLIPACVSLDLYKEQWAFLAVAMVQTRALRPKGFPKFMGNDFFLIGYRIFVRYVSESGKRLRGLYIIKSQTDSKRMEFFGNLFTHYKYTTTDINLKETKSLKYIGSSKSDFYLEINKESEEVKLPIDSPFEFWKEARRYAGPLPFTFTYQEEEQTVLIIEGVRQNWKPKPIEVSNCSFKFLEDLELKGLVLANAFEIEDVPYHWKKGRKELWK